MSSTLSSLASGSLIFREYARFRGVDFSNRKDEVSLQRSPDLLNMWKNYKGSNGLCIETRPCLEIVKEFDKQINGLYFYNENMMVHSGTKLYKNDIVVYDNMAPHKSKAFIYNKLLYILDSENYLVYDGKEIKKVEGYIPTTTISKTPLGNGTVYEDVNFLTGIRKNQFCSDGESTDYKLDVEEFDDDYTVRVWINENEITDFVAYPKEGKIVFSSAPPKPLTDGQDNVIVQFKREIEGYRERIVKCDLVEIFDNRVFFSGNPDYPNMLWHCSLDDPSYCSDLDYYTEGTDDSAIKALVSGNNALWVIKEPSQSNTAIFYHNPSTDDSYGRVYPNSHSSISTGCISTGINFGDDICFFSSRGLESITSDITTEQMISHRSSLIDNKLLNEENYSNLCLAEWEGYLLVFVDNKVYLADSRGTFTMNDHVEYEWFYWELEDKVRGTYVKDGVLFLYGDNKVYSLTNTSDNREVESYLCTMADEIKYPQMWKTTNKKGTVVDCEGEKISLCFKKDNEEFQKVGIYNTKTKGYFKPRIKVKKFKSVELKFSSELPFRLYSCTLEAYVGNVVKR